MSSESDDTRPTDEAPDKNAQLKKIGYEMNNIINYFLHAAVEWNAVTIEHYVIYRAALGQFGSKVATVTKESAVKVAAATKEFDAKYHVTEKTKETGAKMGTWISSTAANVKEKAANSKLLNRGSKKEGPDESDA